MNNAETWPLIRIFLQPSNKLAKAGKNPYFGPVLQIEQRGYPMFSRSCQYAIQSVLYIHLNSRDGIAVKSRDIAESQQIPPHFLGKILQILVRQNVLDSIKGPAGGFTLREGKEELTMLEIVRMIDGMEIFEQCGIGLKNCSDRNPCPIHHDYTAVRKKIRELLSCKTIAALCKDVEAGTSIVNFIPA